MRYGLVKLVDFIPDISFNILYATDRNFTGKAVYPSTCSVWLQKNTAWRLRNVQNSLKKRGIGLMVYDGYRPLSVQRKFWELVPDPRYVGDPSIGSKHNRGCAVDVTLVDSLGREMAMPSGFDDFSERAHRDFKNCSLDLLENRTILEESMVAEGFLAPPTEWWHFEDPDFESHPLLDVSFEELEGSVIFSSVRDR